MTGDESVIGIRQGTVCRETDDIPGTGDGLEAGMFIERKAPTRHVRRQPVNRQRTKMLGFIAQQRRGVAFQHVT